MYMKEPTIKFIDMKIKDTEKWQLEFIVDLGVPRHGTIHTLSRLW